MTAPDYVAKPCSVEDCGRPHLARGWCIGHYRGRPDAATTALRAVLDLHAPHHLDNGTSINYLCVECLTSFPCPTVTAIATALEG